MKNLLFGLTAVGLALGFSAFKNAPQITGSKLVTTYYKLNSTGTTYTRVTNPPNEDLCTEAEVAPCVIALTNDQGPSFNRSILPISGNPTVYESDTNGWLP